MENQLSKFFNSHGLSSDEVKLKALDLGSKYLTGGWNKLEKEDVEVSKITGGQSNLLYLVSSKSPKLSKNEPNCFLIRIHCQNDSKLIFTDTVVFSVLGERGLGPKMYGFFDGGRLEEFLPSRTLDESDIRVPEIACKIAEVCTRFHSVDVPLIKKPLTFKTMREWLKTYQELGGDAHEIKTYSVKYNDGTKIPKSETVTDLLKEVDLFENMCSIFDDRIVFSHNDLWATNILELNDSKELVFIDFEYANYNWRGFDLGMHLSEYAYDYRVYEHPFYKVDQSIYEHQPNIDAFCASYIDRLYQMKADDPSRQFPKTEDRDAEIQNLIKECKFFWPINNLYWAIWSIRNEKFNLDNGMDLLGAASERLSIYFHLKQRSIEIYKELSKE